MRSCEIVLVLTPTRLPFVPGSDSPCGRAAMCELLTEPRPLTEMLASRRLRSDARQGSRAAGVVVTLM